nr:Chain P, PA1 [unidentified]
GLQYTPSWMLVG